LTIKNKVILIFLSSYNNLFRHYSSWFFKSSSR